MTWIYDDFESGTNGGSIGGSSMPGGGGSWTLTTGVVQMSNAQKYNGSLSLSFVNNSSQNDCQFPLIHGTDYSMIFRVLWTGSPAQLTNLIMHGDGTSIIQLYLATNGDLTYYDTSGHVVSNLSINVWHLIEVTHISWSGKTYDIYVDGVIVKSGAAMRALTSQTDVWRFQQPLNTGTCVYIDNIIVGKYESMDIYKLSVWKMLVSGLLMKSGAWKDIAYIQVLKSSAWKDIA